MNGQKTADFAVKECNPLGDIAAHSRLVSKNQETAMRHRRRLAI
jgi:hypothetical protein